MHFIRNESFSRKKDSDSDSDSCELVSKWPKIRILTSPGFKRFVPALIDILTRTIFGSKKANYE